MHVTEDRDMTTTLLEKPQDDTATPARVDQLFFQSRNVIVAGQIDDKLATRTAPPLLAFAAESDAPSHIVISSPGGYVESGDMVPENKCIITHA